MKTRTDLLRILALCGLVAVTFKLITKSSAADHSSGDQTWKVLDSYLQNKVDRLNIPGLSLAVVQGDRIVHLQGFGEAYPNGSAPAPQTPFLIGSLTKSFTALGVMQLVDAGQVNLDQPVQTYLPWFQVADPRDTAEITVRQLLNQTSGLSTASGWIPLTDFDSSPEALELQARALASEQLNHPPGKAFEYSNANYNLLGLIIEAASGKSYPDYIRENIFHPLDMEHSYIYRDRAVKDGLAVGHRYWFWQPIPEPNLPMPRGSLPSGQLISSAEDLGRYLIPYLNEGSYRETRLISPDSLEIMLQGTKPEISAGMPLGDYAMGWYESDLEGTRLLWHTGMVPEYASYLALLPELDLGLVILTNVDHFMMNPVIGEVGEGAARILAGKQPASPQFTFIPWLMRSLLLIPVLQLFGVLLTARTLQRWKAEPGSRPSPHRLWIRHLLLPWLPNLAVLAALVPTLGPLGGFWRLFAPDFTWLAWISGSFAGLWTIFRTGWILRGYRSLHTES